MHGGESSGKEPTNSTIQLQTFSPPSETNAPAVSSNSQDASTSGGVTATKEESKPPSPLPPAVPEASSLIPSAPETLPAPETTAPVDDQRTQESAKHLRLLNNDRIRIGRTLHRLKSTLSTDSGSYASRTLTSDMLQDITYLENLQLSIETTTRKILSQNSERLSREIQDLSPKGKDYIVGLCFGLASIVAKNVAWYGPAKIDNFAGQLAAAYLGALSMEYTLLQEGQRRIQEANQKAGLKDAKVTPSAFQAAMQAFDMIAAPVTLTVIDKFTHGTSVEAADYGFFLGGLAVGSTINSGWPTNALKKRFTPTNNDDQKFTAPTPDEIQTVPLPDGVRATKQARDVQALLEALPLKDEITAIHTRARNANTYLTSLPPQTKIPTGQGAHTAIAMDTPAPVPLPDPRTLDGLRTRLDACKNQLSEAEKWGWREYGTLAASAAAYAGFYGGSAMINNPYGKAAVKFIASTFPQGLAQLGEFVEIPSRFTPNLDRFKNKFPRSYKVAKGAARVAVPLFLEFLALQDATRDVKEGNKFPGVPVPRETTDRIIQEAFRTWEGPLLAWGLAGDTLHPHNYGGMALNAAIAGGAYARDRIKAASETSLESSNTTELPDHSSSQGNQDKEIGRRGIENPSEEKPFYVDVDPSATPMLDKVISDMEKTEAHTDSSPMFSVPASTSKPKPLEERLGEGSFLMKPPPAREQLPTLSR